VDITKYGTVAISEEEVLVSGFHVDGQMPGSWLPPNAGELIVLWAIERLWKTLSEKGQELWLKNHYEE